MSARMKPMLVSEQWPGKDRMTAEEAVAWLKNSPDNCPKFVLMPYVDMDNLEIVLVLAIGNDGEHADIMGSVQCAMYRRGNFRDIGFDPKELGGGRVKIDNGVLVFFGKSNAFGKYNKDLLQKVDPLQFMQLFDVQTIKFE